MEDIGRLVKGQPVYCVDELRAASFKNLPVGTKLVCNNSEETFLVIGCVYVVKELKVDDGEVVEYWATDSEGKIWVVVDSWIEEGLMSVVSEDSAERINYIQRIIQECGVIPHLVEEISGQVVAYYHIKGDVYKHSVVGEIEKWEIVCPLD